MLTYDLHSRTIKTVSTRWGLYPSCILLTNGADFFVTVEPGGVVVWRLRDAGAGAYTQYMDDRRPSDDLHYDDEDFCYIHNDSDVLEKQVRVELN